MYPDTIVEFDDQSEVSSLPIIEVRNRPLLLAVFSSDKGTEDWQRISGKDFFNMYGDNISFARHGQPLLQAAMSINAGAELLCKRLVASDSSVANIGIVASFTDVTTQKKDADGNLLYLDAEGNETTEVTETPANVTSKSIKYSIKTVADVKTIEDAKSDIVATLTEGEYLLYVITDIGRGKSKKRIKIVPNYTLSRSLSYTIYTLSVLEGSKEVESMTFSVNPNLIVNGQNISLQSMVRANSTQIDCEEYSEGLQGFVTAFAAAAGITEDEVFEIDPLFACNRRGKAIDGITVDTTDGIDLQYSYGQMLQSGDNGSFGDYPFSNETEWSKQAVEALDGSFDNTIFNLNQWKINACVDANYPANVKRAIENLATFREDFMYFRDQRLGLTSLELIEDYTFSEAKNMFCASFCQSYDVLDPYTKKEITVTIGYDLAQLLVDHINKGSIHPTAGIKYDMVIKNAIYGTLSFTPTICPEDKGGNQKDKMEELRVNYASYIDNQLVIESLYTSQEKNSQWSYTSNVMGIQDVVKAIRTKCPSIRYTFTDGEDLEKYKMDVEEVISKFRSNFKVLELEYKQDATYSANKIFYAVLKVVYRDFFQTEWIKVTALSAETTVTE